MKLKEPKSFEEQLNILESRGVEVKDRDACISFLKTVNYYRFTAYLLTFRNKDGETYKRVSFETPFMIYMFDQALRTLLFSYIEDIEVYLRTQIAYYHGHKYGPDGYEKASNYNKRHNHETFWKRVEDCIKGHEDSPAVVHHKEKYDGHFPVWVIVELFSIGQLSYFYRGLVYNDREKISRNLYGIKNRTLLSWFRCLTDLRNRCAHYSRLYYWVFPAIPSFSEFGIDMELKEDNRKLFYQILMLSKMYPNSDVWNFQFLDQLEELINTYKHYINLNCIGFPENWKELLKKQADHQ